MKDLFNQDERIKILEQNIGDKAGSGSGSSPDYSKNMQSKEPHFASKNLLFSEGTHQIQSPTSLRNGHLDS
jgi:hypothetical protein